MPGNPFKAPYKSSGRRPKASKPSSAPRSSRGRGNPQMPGVSGRKAVSTVGVKTPKARVTNKATRPKRLPRAHQGAPLGTPGKTGVRNPRKYM